MNKLASAKSSRGRILVVEDEFFIGLEITSALTEAGFVVMGPAASVNAALDLLKTMRPDAAVLDVNLGRGELVTPVAAKLIALRVPFVLASARSVGELASHPSLAEAENIGKPTDLKRLVNSLLAFIS